MLLYCDHCATKLGYDVDPSKTSKGECELCYMRIGPMNTMSDEDVEILVNGISTDIFEISDFTVRQIKGFPIGTVPRKIECVMSQRMLTNDVSMFYDSTDRKLILAKLSTGKRIQITF